MQLSTFSWSECAGICCLCAFQKQILFVKLRITDLYELQHLLVVTAIASKFNVDTMSAEPNAESTCLSKSERSIWSLSSSVNAQAHVLANKRVRKSLSSMSRPSSDNISKELLTTMLDESLLLIVRCVGALMRRVYVLLHDSLTEAVLTETLPCLPQ